MLPPFHSQKEDNKRAMIDSINARNRELNLKNAEALQTKEFQEDGMKSGVPFDFGRRGRTFLVLEVHIARRF